MSNAQRSMHYARALLRAFKKEPSRVARGAVRETAPAKPMRECSRPSALQSLRDSDLHLMNSFQKFRWASAASPVSHAAPSFESCPSLYSASFSSATSPEVSGKPGAVGGSTTDAAAASSEEKVEPIQPCIGDDKGGTGVEQDVKTDKDLAKENEDLLGLLGEREALLEEKDRALTQTKDKLLRSYAEMENLIDRTRREAESTRKYSIQDFAQSLLDVADNLGRALETVRKSVSADDAEINAKLLVSLLEGVEMTDKQLMKVFEKHGLTRFNPEGIVFDPNEHQAVFEVEDANKTPGTVAVVLKTGYKLHDRVIRPAVVGVVKENSE
ncbi:grpE protein homolog 2, mitochondrial [Physcomitrium patens]|uniref:GrpE protein homolog n=1 Tax=Physcomitrium patens TaxID=3218 RepID=A0A2K1J7M9_PHYPA|nr:grpE protein homolog 2, mitochondrial-like [Physcomitrium patens]PNR37540.1 hypothetical protein PHYPA_020649 [Physcomitrium patens]|eukprot:XP_024398069.1 grpE protein homolog 2, mitochondrial-like [Physcomitrella patens]